MAYARFPGQDEELEALQKYGGGGAGAGAGQATATMAAPVAESVSGPSPSGSYTNFDRIFAANKDAAEASAGKVRRGVEGSAEKAQAGLAGLQSSFNAGVNTGSLQSQPTPQQRQQASAGGLMAMSTPAPTAGTYHGQPGSSLDEWKRNSQAKYTGPGSLEALQQYGQVAADTREAQRQLRATGTQEGREALLRRQAQPGGYTRGQSRFDAGLVGAAGGKDFEATRGRYGDLEKGLSAATASSKGMADTARAFTEQAAKGYGGLVSDYERAEAERLAAEKAEANGLYSGIVPPQDAVSETTGTKHHPAEYVGDRTYKAMSPEERAELQRLALAVEQGGDSKALTEFKRRMAAKYPPSLSDM